MRFKIVSLIAVAGLVAACGTAPTAETSKTSGEGQMMASGSDVVAGSQEDLVRVGDRVQFGFDKYDLTAEAIATLNLQAAWMKHNESVRVTIEGHCDERGTREYNLALGERRATAIADYLMSMGISSDRINTISYGKERPENPASNEEAWAQNRRGVMVVR
jgi:peptidoglycan-associated lipoprotein